MKLINPAHVVNILKQEVENTYGEIIEEESFASELIGLINGEHRSHISVPVCDTLDIDNDSENGDIVEKPVTESESEPTPTTSEFEPSSPQKSRVRKY